MSKNWFRNKFKKIKDKIKHHFEIKNLMEICSNLMTKSYIFSIGFNDMYFNKKIPKKFKLCLINCVFSWIISFTHLLILISDELYTLIFTEFLPKPLFVLVALIIFFVSILKTDLIFGEIKYNLSPLKIAYILSVDIKWKHKLTDHNYNKLTLSLRILMVVLIYYFLPFFTIMLSIWLVSLIKSNKLVPLIFEISMIPFYINGVIALSVGFAVLFITILYYKMRFDQIHQQIKSILSNGKWMFIIRRKEKLLFNLIDEHNQVSIEVHKLNMMIRYSVAAMFIYFSFGKIIPLYLMLTTKNALIKLIAINLVADFFILVLALSYLFSLQINSAHQSLKLIHLVCRYKMRTTLRLKVKN